MAFMGRWTQCWQMEMSVSLPPESKSRLSSCCELRAMTRSEGQKVLPEGSHAMGEDDQRISGVLGLKGAIPANRQATRS